MSGLNRPNRMSTGIGGLDTILNGGLIPASVYILQGPPGAGKTTLANQIGFSYAADGGAMLYITLLAESHHRMLANLDNLAFYDAGPIGSQITYVSGFSALMDEGLTGIFSLIRNQCRGRRGALVVIDGLFVLEENAGSIKEFRKFINDLEALAALLGATMLLLTSNGYQANLPEYTMVDGWISLDYRDVGHQAVRELTVRKYRGSGFIPGPHFMEISSEGVQIFPRFESVAVESYPAHEEFVPFGNADLDALLCGGLPRASTTVVIGAAGAGKTTLGLSFLNECTRENPGIFFGFYETPARLEHKAEQLDIPLAAKIKAGAVKVIWTPPGDHLSDALAHRLLREIENFGARRLVIDGISGLRRGLIYNERAPLFFSALSNELRRRDVTAVYTTNAPDLMGAELSTTVPEQSATAENIILLRYLGLRSRMKRTLSVIKARDQEFDPTVFEFSIGRQGIQLGHALTEGANTNSHQDVHSPTER